MTSNLIALWSLREKEREAAEELRHNLESERMVQAAHELEKLRINMDYAIKQNQLREQMRSNRANERIGEINAYWTGRRAQIEENYRSSMIALEQKKQAHDSYWMQKKFQDDQRYKKADLKLREREVETKERAAKLNEFKTGFDLGWKIVTGGLAIG